MNVKIYLRDDPHFVDNLCLSFRHDFGLLGQEEQDNLRFECREWLRSLYNNAQRVCRCDDCRFNIYYSGSSNPPEYPEHYCSKLHWVGFDPTPNVSDVDHWNNCKDYEANT